MRAPALLDPVGGWQRRLRTVSLCVDPLPRFEFFAAGLLLFPLLARDHPTRTATFGTIPPDAQSSSLHSFLFRPDRAVAANVFLSQPHAPSGFTSRSPAPAQSARPSCLPYRPSQLSRRPLGRVQLHVPRHRLDVFPVLRDQPLQRRVLALGRPPRHWPSARL